MKRSVVLLFALVLLIPSAVAQAEELPVLDQDSTPNATILGQIVALDDNWRVKSTIQEDSCNLTIAEGAVLVVRRVEYEEAVVLVGIARRDGKLLQVAWANQRALTAMAACMPPPAPRKDA